MSRQQRRASARADVKRDSRRAQFDRIHGDVLQSRTIQHMWRVYGRERLAPHGIDITDEAVAATLQPAFYAGAAAMLGLMIRVSPDGVTEDQGVEMLQRLHEELDTYSRGLR